MNASLRLVALAISSSMLTLAQPRVSSPIDSTHRVLLKGSLHPKAQARFDQGPVAANFTLGYVTLVLKPSAAQQSDLDELLIQQQDAASPNYHRWLTPEQFGGRFGFSSTDLSAITSWLQSSGLHIETVARAGNWIAFSGSATKVQAAFNTEIHRYLVNGESRFAQLHRDLSSRGSRQSGQPGSRSTTTSTTFPDPSLRATTHRREPTNWRPTTGPPSTMSLRSTRWALTARVKDSRSWDDPILRPATWTRFAACSACRPARSNNTSSVPTRVSLMRLVKPHWISSGPAPSPVTPPSSTSTPITSTTRPKRSSIRILRP